MLLPMSTCLYQNQSENNNRCLSLKSGIELFGNLSVFTVRAHSGVCIVHKNTLWTKKSASFLGKRRNLCYNENHTFAKIILYEM